MSTLSTLAAALGLYVLYELRQSSQYYRQLRGRAIAEAGLATYLQNFVIDGNPADAPASFSSAYHEGRYTVKLDSSRGAFVYLTASGEYGGRKETIRVTVQRSGSSWYATFSAGTLVLKKGSSGTIEGDVHGNSSILLSGQFSVTGAVTQAPPTVQPPEINWNDYKTLAMAQGQYVAGKKTFTRAGNPYTGVWYVTGKVEFENDVVFRGTLVTEDEVHVGKNVTIDTPKPDYPAILAREDVEFDGDNISVTGFVYSEEKIEIEKKRFRLQGAMAAGDELEIKGKEVKIQFDETYIGSLSGITLDGKTGNVSLQIVSWSEN